MERLHWRLYAYISVTAVAAALASAWLIWGFSDPVTTNDVIVAAVLTTIFGVCARYPLLLAPQYQQELSAAPGIAAAILLPPPLALAVCAFGQLSGEGVRKRGRPAQGIFNSSTVALQAGFAGLGHELLAGAFPGNPSLAEVLGLLGAGTAYFVTGVLVFEGIVSIQLSRRPFTDWLERHAGSAQAEISLLFIGGLVALLADSRPWALPLMAIPVAIIYRAFFTQQTDLKVAQANQREAEAARERLTAIVEATPDFVATADSTGRLEYVNAAGRRMLGIEQGAEAGDLSISGHFRDWRRAVSGALKEGAWTGESDLRSPAGRWPVSQVVVAHRDELGQVEFISTIARDITGQKALEEELVHVANHDALTGVFNRRRFEEELQSRITKPQGELGAVLFIDLDDFKDVNDRFGHQAGDAALQGVAAALRDRVARRDDIVARLGGDEFALLITRSHAMQAELAAHRALSAMHEFKLEIGGEWVGLGGSVGVATFESGWTTAEEVMARADAAMYTAKQKKLGVVVAPEPAARRTA